MQGVSRAGVALGCIGLIGALFLSMVVTNPANLGPTGVTVWFLGFWGVLSANIAFLKYELVMRFGKETTKLTKHRTMMVAIRHGSLIGAGLTVLLALSSLQQLDARDVGLVAVLLILIEFYARSRRR